MVSEKGLNGLSKLLQHACYLKVLPLDWNLKTRRLTVITDFRISFHLCVFAYFSLYTIYLVIYYHKLSKSMTIPTQALHIVWISFYFTTSVTFYNIFTRRYEMAIFINHFFSHHTMLSGIKYITKYFTLKYTKNYWYHGEKKMFYSYFQKLHSRGVKNMESEIYMNPHYASA